MKINTINIINCLAVALIAYVCVPICIYWLAYGIKCLFWYIDFDYTQSSYVFCFWTGAPGMPSWLRYSISKVFVDTILFCILFCYGMHSWMFLNGNGTRGIDKLYFIVKRLCIVGAFVCFLKLFTIARHEYMSYFQFYARNYNLVDSEYMENSGYAPWTNSLAILTFCLGYWRIVWKMKNGLENKKTELLQIKKYRISFLSYICYVSTLMIMTLIDEWGFFRFFHVGQFGCPWNLQTWYHVVARRIIWDDDCYFFWGYRWALFLFSLIISIVTLIKANKIKNTMRFRCYVLRKISIILFLIINVRFIGDTSNVNVFEDYYLMNSIPTYLIMGALIISCWRLCKRTKYWGTPNFLS